MKSIYRIMKYLTGYRLFLQLGLSATAAAATTASCYSFSQSPWAISGLPTVRAGSIS